MSFATLLRGTLPTRALVDQAPQPAAFQILRDDVERLTDPSGQLCGVVRRLHDGQSGRQRQVPGWYPAGDIPGGDGHELRPLRVAVTCMHLLPDG